MISRSGRRSRAIQRPAFPWLWIATITSVAALVVEMPSVLSYVVCVLGIFLASVSRAWHLVFAGLLALMISAACSGAAIYGGVATFTNTAFLRYGGLLLICSWRISRSLTLSRSVDDVSRGKVGVATIRRSLLLCGIAGVGGAAIQYREGIPALSANVDVVRDVARGNTNVLVGSLQQGWTVGMLLSLTLVILMKRRSPLNLLMVVFFVLGSLLGASRNTVLSGIIPVLVVSLVSVASPLPIRKRGQARFVGTMFASASIILLAAVLAGARTAQGSGAFERAFIERTGGSVLLQGEQTILLALTAPVETWARLAQEQASSGTGFGGYTLAWAGSALSILGLHPDMNFRASVVSAPFYMNATTFAGPPLLDGGLAMIIVASVGIGIVAGVFDARLIWHSNATIVQVQAAYAIYVTFLGLYDYQPFYTIGPALVIVVLGLIGRAPRSRGDNVSRLGVRGA